MPYNQDPYGDPRGRRDNRDRARRVDSQRDGAAYRQTRDGYAAARPRASRPAAFEGQRYGAPSPRPRRPDARPSGPYSSSAYSQRPSSRPRTDGRPRTDARSRATASRPYDQPRPRAGARPSASRGRSRYDTQPRYASQPRGRGSARGRRSGGNLLAGGMAVLASGITGGTRSSGLNRRQSAPSGARNVIVGIVAVAVVAIIGVLLWSNRKVDITLNGEAMSIRVGSTCEEVIQTAELSPKAGNLVSVSGKRLQEGAGYAYTAKLGGNELSEDDAKNYRVSPGDSLDISDGGDRMEDYDVQVMTEEPQLEMGGDAWGNLSYVSQWPKAGQYEMRTGKRSGETARGDTIEETQNAVVTIHQISPDDDSKKLVALTFDDGPAESYTEKYLEILDKYGIHATFFNLGQNIEEYPELAKEICDRGSEVMSHTYQHQQLSQLDASALQKEFSSTFSTIESTTGVKTTGFRPPYGDFTEKAWLNSGGLASVSVLWNQDSLDWKRPGVDAIVGNSTKNVTSGSIILMHDGGGNRDQDVEALPKIIEKLQAEGYEFVTVTELMKSDSSIPADVAAGDAAMPDGCVWPTQIKSDDSSSDDSGSDSSSGSGSDS